MSCHRGARLGSAHDFGRSKTSPSRGGYPCPVRTLEREGLASRLAQWHQHWQTCDPLKRIVTTQACSFSCASCAGLVRMAGKPLPISTLATKLRAMRQARFLPQRTNAVRRESHRVCPGGRSPRRLLPTAPPHLLAPLYIPREGWG